MNDKIEILNRRISNIIKTACNEIGCSNCGLRNFGEDNDWDGCLCSDL